MMNPIAKQPLLRPRFLLLVSMVVGAAAMRLLPHPPNFTPVGAMALFAGAHFGSRLSAFSVPLFAMLVSDTVFELVFGWGFHSGMPAVYGSFALVVVCGRVLRNKRGSPLAVGTAALSSATLFYVITNFSLWLTSDLYPHTLTGLGMCYVAAIPFFGSMLVGDLLHALLFFGSFALVERRYPIFATAARERAVASQ